MQSGLTSWCVKLFLERCKQWGGKSVGAFPYLDELFDFDLLKTRIVSTRSCKGEDKDTGGVSDIVDRTFVLRGGEIVSIPSDLLGPLQ